MSYIGTYLDKLIEKRQLKSDGELANYLKISRQHLSRIRIQGVLGEEKCYVVAKGLDIEPLELLSYMRAKKSKLAELQNIWMELHRKTKRVKAYILLNSNL